MRAYVVYDDTQDHPASVHVFFAADLAREFARIVDFRMAMHHSMNGIPATDVHPVELHTELDWERTDAQWRDVINDARKARK